MRYITRGECTCIQNRVSYIFGFVGEPKSRGGVLQVDQSVAEFDSRRSHAFLVANLGDTLVVLRLPQVESVF